jgi:raffinose/stachyose/melibiose transport system substrate-binding protein
MKIKLGVGIATVLVAGTALTGCSGSSAPQATSGKTDGKVSGTLTGAFDVAFKSTISKITTNFEKKYPGVKVNINYQGGDVASLISTQLQAGTAPDILLTFPGGEPGAGANVNVVTLASQGRLLDLSKSAWTGKIPEAWKTEVSYKSGVYAYPGAVQPLAAIYNQAELDKLGLKAPTTLTEVYKLCADAKAAGIYAYAQGLGESAAGPQMMSFGQNASLVYGPNPDFDKQIADGTATYANSPWVDQFKIYQQMFDKGCFGKGSLGRSRQQGAEAVAGGKALGQVDVGADLAIMKGLAPKGSFVIAPIPATDDGKNFVTALPGYTVAANAKAKNPTAAKAFLDFLAEPEQSVIYANGFSSVPIIPNDLYTAPKDLAGFADLIAAGKYAKLANVLPKVQSTLNESVQSMMLGKDTPQSAAEKMDQARKG